MSGDNCCYGETMSSQSYAAFLPPGRRAAAELEPEESWWQWRSHDVHIARARRAEASVRVLVIHGSGGHSGALWPLAALIAERGFDVAAVDLPLYGRTTSPDPGAVRYVDWVRLLVDLIEAEHDGRPLILFGGSMGGMLAYEVAARSSRVAAVAATSLLDPRDWRVRSHITRFGRLGVLCGPLSSLVLGRLANAMIPMRWVADFAKMSRDPGLSRLCAGDPLGGGARVPLGFLTSYLRYRHAPPEAMKTPVTLMHPSRDAWTPVELSTRFFRRIASPGNVVMLRECGHFPIEEPGISDLVAEILRFAKSIEASP